MVFDELDHARRTFDLARRDRSRLWNRERLLSSIDAAGCDGVLAVSIPNVMYTSGSCMAFDVLPTFVLTTASGDQAIVVNETDSDFITKYSHIERVVPFSFGPDAEADAAVAVGKMLREAGLSHGTVGIEGSLLSTRRLELLRAHCPTVTWTEAGSIFDSVRLIKTPAEVDLLREAARVTLEAILAAFDPPDGTRTEKDFEALVQSGAIRSGADAISHTLVNAGLNSALVHSVAFERKLKPGELLHVDFGARFAGYCSDIARNAVFREPSRRQADYYKRLREVYNSVTQSMRPGITGGDIYARSQAAMAKVGLTYLWGTIGHSIGLSLHEGFEFAKGVTRQLEPGMVICYEPSFVVDGDGRYDIEDMFVVTADGIECLAPGDDSEEMHQIVQWSS